MERRYENRQIDLGTLLTYVLLSMGFAVGAIVAVALVFAVDIHVWNPTAIITAFFVITGGISGLFILLK